VTRLNAPQRRRRNAEARPGEIVQAALEVFAERGFAGARIDDIAARAGVSKGAVYLYFQTKDELFRAVVGQAVTPNIEQVKAAAEAFDGPFAALAPMLLQRVAMVVSTSRLPAVVKMVIGESSTFPDLARVWHEQVISQAIGLITGLIAYGEVFAPLGAVPIDLPALARQHAETALHGMLSGARS
jgi:AcrR family transcriptional regulator